MGYWYNGLLSCADIARGLPQYLRPRVVNTVQGMCKEFPAFLASLIFLKVSANYLFQKKLTIARIKSLLCMWAIREFIWN